MVPITGPTSKQRRLTRCQELSSPLLGLNAPTRQKGSVEFTHEEKHLKVTDSSCMKPINNQPGSGVLVVIPTWRLLITESGPNIVIKKFLCQKFYNLKTKKQTNQTQLSFNRDNKISFDLQTCSVTSTIIFTVVLWRRLYVCVYSQRREAENWNSLELN